VASARAARRRGYHALVFDGPGQGEVLIQQKRAMRPDWEAVVSAVLDVAVLLPGMDAERIALSGWSLGGYLALRAASAERRISACIADPGLAGMLAVFGRIGAMAGLPPKVDPTRLDDAALGRLDEAVSTNPALKWAIVQRGYWVLGASDLRGFLAIASTYTLDGRIGEIRCPTFIAEAESDPLSGSAEAVYAALACPKTLVRFSDTDGAGTHCEMHNRPLLNQRTLDWLDSTFEVSG
jgi:pimeloyl-ACP methyl ester carboxylesterase